MPSVKHFGYHSMKIIKAVIALGFVNYIYACVPYLTNIYNEFYNLDGAPLTEGKKIFSLCSITVNYF